MHRKIIFVFVLLFIICFCIINTNSFKRFFINSAMTSMNHQYLAYILYDEDTINEIMLSNYVEEVSDEINLDLIDIGNFINKNKYDKEILDRDDDIYKIIRIEEKKFKGYLTVVYDPANVSLGVSSKLGKSGESVNTIVSKNKALLGINGGGFEDIDGFGNGSRPYGVIIKDKKVIWNGNSCYGSLIGFTDLNKLYITKDSADVAIKNGMRDAVEFGPILMINGKSSKIFGDGGWGIAPRSVIGQRKDGIVLLLVIEGRLPGYSIGASMKDVINIMKRYGAYNVANLDGGSSSTMSVDGKLYNKVSVGSKYGGRKVSNAWIVKDNK